MGPVALLESWGWLATVLRIQHSVGTESHGEELEAQEHGSNADHQRGSGLLLKQDDLRVKSM